MRNRTFLLVDINSYFATLLQQENPKLRNKPVVIVKDLGRNCIIAASKEAKKKGVKTGTNLAIAKRLAPDVVEMKAEFDLYLSATNKLNKLFEQISPQVDIYSLDEAFIEISDCLKNLYPDPVLLGKKIQQKIKDELGDWVTANVGIGPNRFLAKMAAEISPKGSVFAIDQENLDCVLAEVGFDDVCGIGGALSRKLKMMGVFHPYQIRFYSEDDFKPLFGPFWSKELLKMAYGREPHHLALLDENDRTKLDPTSISRSITLWNLTDDEAQIKKVLYSLTREVIYKARRLKLAGRRVSLSLSGSNFLNNFTWRRHLTLSCHLDHTASMFEQIYKKIYLSWQRNFKPIKFKVALGLLKTTKEINPSLLPDWKKQESLESALDEISQRFGLFSVRSALLLDEKDLIHPEVTGFFGDKKFQFNKLNQS
ncbi:MAG: hypothetical protein U9O78_01380 [Patescibacteria group bacterium]|nr:hypothetical protein [Patescibacteria group bacterium]